MINKSRQEQLIKLAQKEAEKAIQEGNVPFGAVLTDSLGGIVVVAHNTQISSNDPIAHAEINLLRRAGKKLKSRYLDGCRVFGNAAPCSMCVSACIKAHIRHFYYGASPEKTMDPWITVFDLAKKSKRKIYIYPNILKESSERQIKEGREKITKGKY